MAKRGLPMNLLDDILQLLVDEKPLDPKHRDHALIGNYAGFHECHILADWLLIYEDRRGKFRRVDFDGHDWVHSYIGKYTGSTVYCAVDQWQKMCDYYADPNNFKYYYGVGYYMSETSVQIPDIEQQKFDELLAFSKDNSYNPFGKQTNEKAQRISESEFYEGICFYKVSNDGFFMTIKSPMYFVYDGKLWLVFYHDIRRDNGGVKEVVAVDVPDELGQYFIGLIGE